MENFIFCAVIVKKESGVKSILTSLVYSIFIIKDFENMFLLLIFYSDIIYIIYSNSYSSTK